MSVAAIAYRLRNGIIAGLLGMMRIIPWSWNIRLGRFIGWIAYHLAGKRSQIAIDNLRAVYGTQWDERRIRHTACLVFQHLVVTALETLRLPVMYDQIKNAYWYDPQQMVMFQEVVAQKRGLLLLIPHLGNWEMGGAWLVGQGIPLSVVARPQRKDPYLHQLIDDIRTGAGMEVIYKDNALPSVIRALRQGRAVVLLMDQHVIKEGLEVPFMGRPAMTLAAPALLARRLGVPVMVASLWRRENWMPAASAFPPIPIQQTDDDQADLVENTARFNQVIAQAIDQHPEQWMWMHRRWRDS